MGSVSWCCFLAVFLTYTVLGLRRLLLRPGCCSQVHRAWYQGLHRDDLEHDLLPTKPSKPVIQIVDKEELKSKSKSTDSFII